MHMIFSKFVQKKNIHRLKLAGPTVYRRGGCSPMGFGPVGEAAGRGKGAVPA